MRKRTKIILGILVFVLAILAIGIYWQFIRDVTPVDNKLITPDIFAERATATASVSTTTPDTIDLNPTTTVSSDTRRIYTMDLDRTSLNFKIDSSVGDITGKFDIVGDWLALVPEADGWRLVAVLRIDGRTADTGQGFIDSLLELGFEAERYPYGLFVGSATQLISDLDASNQLELEGQLELHGVIQDATIPIQIQFHDDILVANAQMTVDARDYDVQFASAVGGNILDAKIRVFARPASPDEITELQRTPTPQSYE